MQSRPAVLRAEGLLHRRLWGPPQARTWLPAPGSGRAKRRFLGSDCLTEMAEDQLRLSPVPSSLYIPRRARRAGAQGWAFPASPPQSHPQLTTRKQDRGQCGGGLSFILRPCGPQPRADGGGSAGGENRSASRTACEGDPQGAAGQGEAWPALTTHPFSPQARAEVGVRVWGQPPRAAPTGGGQTDLPGLGGFPEEVGFLPLP